MLRVGRASLIDRFLSSDSIVVLSRLITSYTGTWLPFELLSEFMIP